MFSGVSLSPGEDVKMKLKPHIAITSHTGFNNAIFPPFQLTIDN
jgi:hypothetical protein